MRENEEQARAFVEYITADGWSVDAMMQRMAKLKAEAEQAGIGPMDYIARWKAKQA